MTNSRPGPGSSPPIRVAALYRFARFDDPHAIRTPLDALCRALGLRGTLLIAREGINGTIAGSHEAIDTVLDHIRALPGCGDLDVKLSDSEALPFHRMKVRIKREIVTMGEPDIDPLTDAGRYVAPEDWNALIAEPGTILIDTRNDYEVAIGSFSGAIDPKMQTFRDFPAWFRARREALLGTGEPPRVAMFCTGGIRCEKASAFLKAEGIDEVYHLEGGILRYLETILPEESRWQGECFVFDQRVAIGHGLAQGTHGLCHACRRPVSDTDPASPRYVAGGKLPGLPPRAQRRATRRLCRADAPDRDRRGPRGRAHRRPAGLSRLSYFAPGSRPCSSSIGPISGALP